MKKISKIGIMILTSFLFAITLKGIVQAQNTSELIEEIKSKSPEAAEVISDFFYLKSCGQKKVIDFNPREVQNFIQYDRRYAFLLSARISDEKLYKTIKDSLLYPDYCE